MSKILVQIAVNIEVNTSLDETEALFLVVLEIRNSEKLCNPSWGCEIPKSATKHFLGTFEFSSYHRHFHHDDVIIMLYVSSTNCTICHHSKAMLYMLYILCYCTDNLSWGK